MRIVWSEASAGEIAASLKALRERLQESLHQSEDAQSALREANPDRDNKRLNAIESRFEEQLARIRQKADEIQTILSGLSKMTEAFENAERDARKRLEALGAGHSAENFEPGMSGAYAGGEITRPLTAVPLPAYAPHSEIGAFGPVPGWLNELLQKRRSSIKGG